MQIATECFSVKNDDPLDSQPKPFTKYFTLQNLVFLFL